MREAATVTAIESAMINVRTTNIRTVCDPVQRLNECLYFDRLIILPSFLLSEI